MSIKQPDVPAYTVTCDGCEGETTDTIEDMNQVGWRQIETTGETLHFCPGCANFDAVVAPS